MQLPKTEKVHTILFVGIGLGVLLSYGLGTGSYSTLKWVFLYLGVALVLVFYYLFAKDSPSSRRVVPWALLIAAVVNFLIVMWIASYISLLYPYDKVYVRKSKNNYFNDEELPYNSYETDPKSSNYRK